MGEGKSTFKILIDKTTGKRPLGRSIHRLENNIKMDIKETDISTSVWVDSAQDMNY
jgi:hypothetical protein